MADTALTPLTIFYTQNLRGDFALLPRLHRFLAHLRTQSDTTPLLLDIGGSCHDSVWHCAATKGRSTLLVMDAMGYHAVNVSGILSPSDRDALSTRVTTGMVTERHGWRYFVPPHRDDDIVIAGTPTPALKLCIVAAPADSTHLTDRMLHLQSVTKGQVGSVRVDLAQLAITEQVILTLPDNTKPDATIAASVELIEDEARQAQKRQ